MTAILSHVCKTSFRARCQNVRIIRHIKQIWNLL